MVLKQPVELEVQFEATFPHHRVNIFSQFVVVWNFSKVQISRIINEVAHFLREALTKDVQRNILFFLFDMLVVRLLTELFQIHPGQSSI